MDVKLHVDLETLQLIQGPGQRSAVTSLRFKRGDAAKLQVVFLESGITPTTIKKAVRDLISISKEVAKTEEKMEKDPESMSREELEKLIGQVQKQMKAAAAELNFEMAAELRDKMITLKKSLDDMEE